MVWMSMKSLSYNSMMECHENLVKKVDNPNLAVLKKFVDTDSLKLASDYKSLISYIEKTYKCSGICKEALFFYSLELKEGRPLKTCSEAILESFIPFVASLG